MPCGAWAPRPDRVAGKAALRPRRPPSGGGPTWPALSCGLVPFRVKDSHLERRHADALVGW